MKKIIILSLVVILSGVFLFSSSQENYRTYNALMNDFKRLTSNSNVKIKTAGKSSLGKDIFYVQIGPDGDPAIFIGANISGFDLSATEGAFKLTKSILENIERKNNNYINKTFYVFPVLNPDLYSEKFSKVVEERRKNYTPVDEDGDGKIDEDCSEDLNKDGYITIMRKKSPEGRYIEDNFPFELKRADRFKGEEGIYEYYDEGIDNDNDGKYNEDSKGGVIINNNFPVLFKYNNKPSGLYPVSEKTTKTIVDFVLSKKNIILSFILDRTNNMLNLPEQGRSSTLGSKKVKVPDRFGKYMGIDTSKEYTISELVDIIKGMGFGGGIEITEEMVANFLGIAPPVNVDKDDYKYYQELSKKYKEIAKKTGVNIKRKSEKEEDGSIIKWFYFNNGIISIGLDVWSLPEKEEKKASKKEITVEKIKGMSKDEFLAIEDEKLKEFFKEYNIPPNFKISMLKNMVKAGRFTPEKIAEYLTKYKKSKQDKGESKALQNFIETELNGKGLIKWTKYEHPQLGVVEIGGIAPYTDKIPPYKLINKNIPLVNKFFDYLVEKTHEIDIEDLKVEKQGSGFYKVSFYIVNKGYFPFYSNMAKRNKYLKPILVKLDVNKNMILIEGEKLNRISDLGGKGDSKKIEYLLHAKGNKRLKLTIMNDRMKTIEKIIDLGGK